MSVELWVGQQKKAVRELVHTLGWKEANVREYITSAMVAERTAEGITSFSQQYGVSISGVTATVELKPSLCPLNPCPLKTDSHRGRGRLIRKDILLTDFL